MVFEVEREVHVKHEIESSSAFAVDPSEVDRILDAARVTWRAGLAREEVATPRARAHVYPRPEPRMHRLVLACGFALCALAGAALQRRAVPAGVAEIRPDPPAVLSAEPGAGTVFGPAPAAS